MFTLDADADLDGLVASLRRLPELIAEIRSYEVLADAGLAEGNAQVAVIGTFDDEAGWRAYLEHPEHQAVVLGADPPAPRQPGCRPAAELKKARAAGAPPDAPTALRARTRTLLTPTGGLSTPGAESLDAASAGQPPSGSTASARPRKGQASGTTGGAGGPGAGRRPPRPGSTRLYCSRAMRSISASVPRASTRSLELVVALVDDVEPLLGPADARPLLEEGPGRGTRRRRRPTDGHASMPSSGTQRRGAAHPDGPPRASGPRASPPR